jgi:hypothetical protein
VRRSAIASLAVALAQSGAPAAAPEPVQDFQLDIGERRIHRPDLQAGTELRLQPGDGGIQIQVGAAVSARAVDVLLRNVRGTVRFRFDTSRLDAVRSPAPAAAPLIPESDQQR